MVFTRLLFRVALCAAVAAFRFRTRFGTRRLTGTPSPTGWFAERLVLQPLWLSDGTVLSLGVPVIVESPSPFVSISWC